MGFLSRNVFTYRRGLMDALMDRMAWDAIAFVTPDFFQFGTNFHTDVQTWERPIVLVVPRNGEPFAVMHELSTNHIRFAREAQRMWVDDITMYAEHPRVGSRLALYPQWPELVAELLKAKGLHRARIGLGRQRRLVNDSSRPVHPIPNRQHRARHDAQGENPGQNQRPPAAPKRPRRCIYSGIWVHIPRIE